MFLPQPLLITELHLQVWSLRVDVHILQADGNVSDAAVLCVLAALLAFRRPAVTVGGSDGRYSASDPQLSPAVTSLKIVA